MNAIALPAPPPLSGQAIELAQLDQRTGSWLANLQVAAEVARQVADTDFVPAWCRHNVPAVTAVMLYGLEVGLGPMGSLRGVIMVDGRPTMYAETQRALVHAAGHQLWLEEATIAKATWAGRRRGDEHVWRVTWTMENAIRAGLATKKVWQQYPADMLVARSSAALVRRAFADVIGGLPAAEEFDQAPPQLDVQPATPAAPQVRQRPEARGAALPSAEPRQVAKPTPLRGERPPMPGGYPDEPVAGPAPASPPPAPTPEPLTQAQLRRLQALFREQGITRDDRLRYCSRAVGRPVGSSNELTTDEASRIIDLLDFKPGQDLTPVGQQARAVAFDAALAQLDDGERFDLADALVRADQAPNQEGVTGEHLAATFPAVEPSPAGLEALRARLVETLAEDERQRDLAAAVDAARELGQETAPKRRHRKKAPEPESPQQAGDAPAAPSTPQAGPGATEPEPAAGGAAAPQFPDDLDDLQPRPEQLALSAADLDARQVLRLVVAAVPIDDRVELGSLLVDAGFTARSPSHDVDRLTDVLILEFPDVKTPRAVLALRDHLAEAQRGREEDPK